MLTLLAATLLLPPVQVPPIGRIFGVRVNVDTMEALESRLGPGLPFTGGHPRGARAWRDPARGWAIAADGFEYARNGRYAEAIWLEPLAASSKAPKVRGAPDYGVFRPLRPGMGREAVRQALRHLSGRWQGDVFGQAGHADLRHATNPEVENLRWWKAEFRFAKDRLTGITLVATENEN